MSKEAARRKSAKAIATLRECGMSDAEIEAELGCSLQDVEREDAEIIDAEIVENLPAVVKTVASERTDEGDEPIKPERDWPYGPVPERRCQAHSTRTGERCKNAAILGATVCRFHGGAAKHVKAAARARLENAADRMARNLLGLATEAESEPVRLGATNSALDRAGLRPPAEVVLSQGNSKPYEEVYEGIAGYSREESRQRRGYAQEGESGSNASGYADLAPEYVDRQGSSPLYQHRADPAAAAATALADQLDTQSGRDAPPGGPRPRGFDRERGNQRPVHLTGDDAMAAARLANEASGALPAQRELTSPHKRYPRP